MARTINKDKIALIAGEYCTNGFDQVKALTYAGYTLNYAQHYYKNIFSNVQLKQAIDRIQASTRAKTGYTIDQYLTELQEAIELAKTGNQPSAMVSGIIAKGRSQGFDKDNDMATDQTQELDQSRTEEARELAKIRLMPNRKQA